MKVDLMRTKPITSSFLSCEKDAETILRKLFVESGRYSEILKRLLIINAKDCLDNTDSEVYKDAIKISVKDLRNKGYIRLEPKIRMYEHGTNRPHDDKKEEKKNKNEDCRDKSLKSYIILTFDNFVPNPTNPKFRDCIVTFDVICHTDYWDIGDFRLRPLKIIGYIDGLLDDCKLSGIGTFHFAGCNELILSEDLSGYTLTYKAIHGSDDQIPPKDI